MGARVLNLVNQCALCGRRLPGTRDILLGHGRRHWAGWEIKNEAGVHIRYIPDDPKLMCGCAGRGDECDNNPPTPEENAFFERSKFCQTFAK